MTDITRYVIISAFYLTLPSALFFPVSVEFTHFKITVQPMKQWWCELKRGFPNVCMHIAQYAALSVEAKRIESNIVHWMTRHRLWMRIDFQHTHTEQKVLACETVGQIQCNQIRCKITEPWNRKSEWYILSFRTNNTKKNQKNPNCKAKWRGSEREKWIGEERDRSREITWPKKKLSLTHVQCSYSSRSATFSA